MSIDMRSVPGLKIFNIWNKANKVYQYTNRAFVLQLPTISLQKRFKK